LIAYFIGNISAKKYQNAFTCIKVIVTITRRPASADRTARCEYQAGL